MTVAIGSMLILACASVRHQLGIQSACASFYFILFTKILVSLLTNLSLSKEKGSNYSCLPPLLLSGDKNLKAKP